MNIDSEIANIAEDDFELCIACRMGIGASSFANLEAAKEYLIPGLMKASTPSSMARSRIDNLERYPEALGMEFITPWRCRFISLRTIHVINDLRRILRDMPADAKRKAMLLAAEVGYFEAGARSALLITYIRIVVIIVLRAILFVAIFYAL